MTFIVPPCDKPIDYLYEDDDLVVVSKPDGLLSVPGRDERNRDCLVSRVEARIAGARIVHRLDFATSGIMVLAKHSDAHRHLSQQFEKRKVSKAYIAVVDGQVQQEAGEVDAPLICDWPNRPKQMVDWKGGKSALTQFQRLEYCEVQNTSRLKLIPVTGRSHQLRVHMQHMGHPILGCEFYASDIVREKSARLLLHACELGFYQPSTGEWLSFSQLPAF